MKVEGGVNNSESLTWDINIISLLDSSYLSIKPLLWSNWKLMSIVMGGYTLWVNRSTQSAMMDGTPCGSHFLELANCFGTILWLCLIQNQGKTNCGLMGFHSSFESIVEGTGIKWQRVSTEPCLLSSWEPYRSSSCNEPLWTCLQ